MTEKAEEAEKAEKAEKAENTSPREYKTRCQDCRHSARCQFLLGPSYDKDGGCDWAPSRFSLAAATVCTACGFKFGHDPFCHYVDDCHQRRYVTWV